MKVQRAYWKLIPFHCNIFKRKAHPCSWLSPNSFQQPLELINEDLSQMKQVILQILIVAYLKF